MSNQFTLTQAQQIVNAAIKEAANQGIAVSVVVTDRGGHIVTSARMDTATYLTLETGRRKAATATNFGAPTHQLLEFLSSQTLLTNPLAAGSIVNLPDVALVPGGFPIILDGNIVGGLGISGGRGGQDQQIAEAGLAVLTVAA